MLASRWLRPRSWMLAVVCCGSAAAVAGMTLTLCTDKGSSPPGPPQLTVHEWGTFTVLHDDQGRSLGGINVDEEELPSFVHQLGVLDRAVGAPLRAKMFSKGVPTASPLVRGATRDAGDLFLSGQGRAVTEKRRRQRRIARRLVD